MQPRDRRTTLGVVPSTMFNTQSTSAGGVTGGKSSRISMGPARVATGAPTTSGGVSRASVGMFGGAASSMTSSSAAPPPVPGRMSIAGGGTTARRSSTGIRKDDPRPIMSAAFVREQYNAIVQYLLDNHYDHDISPSLLKGPMLVEFKNIFTFLTKYFVPKFQLSDKFDNDITAFLKLIKYPSSISKTALIAPGTAANWPHCIAALGWMVELCRYCELYRDAETNDSTGDSRLMFFNHIAKTYNAYLGGDDDMADELDAQLEQSFRSRVEAAAEELVGIQSQCNEANGELAKLQAVESSLPGLHDMKKAFVADLEKFATLISQFESHKTQLQSKIGDLTAQNEAKDAEIAAAQEQYEALKRKREAQTITAAEAEKMKQERIMLVNQLNALGDAKSSAEKSLHESELAFQKAQADLKLKLQAYNEAAEEVAEEKKGDKDKVREVKRNVKVTLQFTDAAKPVLVPEKDTVRDALRALKGLFTHQATESRTFSQELQEKVDAGQESAKSSRRVIESLEAQLAKAEEMLKREREAFEAELASCNSELKSTESEMESIRAQLNMTMEGAKEVEASALTKLIEEVKQEKADFAAERQRIHSDIVQALTMLTAHVTHIQTKLNDGIQELADRKSAVLAPTA